MTSVNLYFYVEALSLTTPQLNTLVAQLQALGQRNADTNPRMRNHWRTRLDGQAVIFEAWWDDSHLTALAMRNRLAAIFGVANTNITYATSQTAFGPLVTYTYASVDRLRVGVFAGPTATYQDSQAAALDYLSDNAATWEG
jgi:hypothetical protein